jgi:hypothetical protein
MHNSLPPNRGMDWPRPFGVREGRRAIVILLIARDFGLATCKREKASEKTSSRCCSSILPSHPVVSPVSRLLRLLPPSRLTSSWKSLVTGGEDQDIQTKKSFRSCRHAQKFSLSCPRLYPIEIEIANNNSELTVDVYGPSLNHPKMDL